MGSPATMSSLPKLSLALAVALVVAVPVALASEEGEVEREAYVERLEPTCKRNTEANSRILKGVKGQVTNGKLVPAGKRFIRASRVLGRSVAQMAKVPKPGADEARLSKWFDYLKREKRLLQLIGRSLKAGNKYAAQKFAVNLNRNNNRANNTVISFGFKECRIDSSRFI